MDFELTMEQEILRRSVREFAEKEIKPVAAELDEKEEFSYDTMKAMAELGLFGMVVPEKYGGQSMDYVSYIIATEEIARVDGSHAATVAAGNSLGIMPLYYFGNEEQKHKYLPKLCSGEHVGALAMSEPNAGSDVVSMKLNARRKGDHYVLNGSKMWITNGPDANTYIIYAKTDPDAGSRGITAFIVERDFAGFSRSPKLDKLGCRGSNTCELVFEDCEVPAENILRN